MRIVNFVMSHRVDDIYRVGPEFIEIPRRFVPALQFAGRHSAVVCRGGLASRQAHAEPHEHVKSAAKQLTEQPLSAEGLRLFLEFLVATGTARSVDSQSARDRRARSCSARGGVIFAACCSSINTTATRWMSTRSAQSKRPKDFSRTTAARSGVSGDSAQGTAAPGLLLHDAGKGFEEDHSEVGRRLHGMRRNGWACPSINAICWCFSCIAICSWRRSRSVAIHNDPEVLLNFNYEVGSPDALRMLFVLTRQISPCRSRSVERLESQLLAGFYDRCMIWLSGKSYLFEEPARLQRTFADVQKHLNLAANEPITVGVGWNPCPHIICLPRIRADRCGLRDRSADCAVRDRN